jgi:hypothetical protein
MPQDESPLPPTSFEVSPPGMDSTFKGLDGLLGVPSGFSSALLHDLRQPVSAILFNALAALRLVRKAEPSGQPIVEESLQDIISEVDRLKSLLQGFGTYLGLGGEGLPGMDVNHTVTAALRLLEGECVRRQVRMSTAFGQALPMLRLSPSSLTRAVITLALEFFQALESLPAEQRAVCAQTELTQDGVKIQFQSHALPASREESPAFRHQFQALGVQTFCSSDLHGKMTWGILLPTSPETLS